MNRQLEIDFKSSKTAKKPVVRDLLASAAQTTRETAAAKPIEVKNEELTRALIAETNNNEKRL